MYQLVAFNAPHGALDRIECSVKPAVGKMNHHAIDAQRPAARQNGGSGEIAEAGAFHKLVKGAALVSGHEIEGDERLVAQRVSRAMRLREPLTAQSLSLAQCGQKARLVFIHHVAKSRCCS